jgi:hypothetical protein
MKRKLTIILRTCGKVYSQHGGRYIDKTKPEIINVCVSSLVNSINLTNGHDIELFVLDDHSDESCVSDLVKILSKCKATVHFVPLDVTGNGPTMEKVYEIVQNHATDLWYHVEDDYLHKPEAIQDMIDTVTRLEEDTGSLVAINPHDDIWRYKNQIYHSIILLGPYRHYRTVQHSTYTCLASREIYDTHKQWFDAVVSLTKARADWVEDKSINKVWQSDGVMLFSPIPGLAFHIMDPSGKDPYLDFDALWNSTPGLWK